MDNLLTVLKNRNFLYLWLCEAFSQVAMNMLNFILVLTVFSLTSSNKAVSGIILSFTIPAVIFGILAGVFVDRWTKKKVLFATNIIRFIFILILSFLYKNIIFVYSISFLSAIVTQFFIPAETPMIPLIVKKNQLLSANALFSLALFGSIFLAYGLSGPVILFFGLKTSFILLSAIFFIASIFAILIKTKENDLKKSDDFDLFNDTKNTIRAIVNVPEVFHAFLLLILTQVLTLIISVLGPGYAKEILRININTFPIFFLTPAVIGMAAGAFVVSNFLSGFSRHKIATLGLFIASFAIIMMPYATQINLLRFIRILFLGLARTYSIRIFISSCIAFVLGFSNSLIFVPSNTLVQEHSSDQIRGKIYGALNSASALISILPVILAGWFADTFGVGFSLIILGIIVFMIGLLRLTL